MEYQLITNRQAEPDGIYLRSLVGKEGKAMSAAWTMPIINLRATGQNIKKMRQAAGISVRDLQTLLGFANPQAIYKWQNGESLPSIDNLVILAAVLDVTIDEILVTDADTSIKGMGDLDTQAVACNSNQHSGSYWMGTRDGI